MRYLILMLILWSCGAKVKIDAPEKVAAEVGIKYEEVAKFCDNRYGEKTREAEDCFDDYRNFLKIGFSVNSENRGAYCESFYIKEEDIANCESNLYDLLK